MQKGSATLAGDPRLAEAQPAAGARRDAQERALHLLQGYQTASVAGAEGVALTAQRSLAVDTTLTPYGTPIWIDTTRPVAKKTGHRNPIAA